MPDKHALLGPSSAAIWSNCTKSARLSEQFPNKPTKYTEEGTRAHAGCEVSLRRENGEQLEMPPLDDAEMADCVARYHDFVVEERNALTARTGKPTALLVEVEVDLSAYVPESFGTSDAVLISGDTIHVIDFKYGKGVPVSALGNPQLRLYALGAYLAYSDIYDLERVRYSIFQPRLDNISSEEISVFELLEWAKAIGEKAKLAFAGEGEFRTGDHCRFCRAAGACRARAEEAFRVVDMAGRKPPTISDEEIPDILNRLDAAEKWIESVREYAQSRAIYDGVHWEGYKLVEGNTKRRIDEPLKVLETLEKEGYVHEDLTEEKLRSLTELERLVGRKKFQTLVGDLIIKPKGSPVLVKETDRRPEINIAYEAFKEEIQ